MSQHQTTGRERRVRMLIAFGGPALGCVEAAQHGHAYAAGAIGFVAGVMFTTLLHVWKETAP